MSRTRSVLAFLVKALLALAVVAAAAALSLHMVRSRPQARRAPRAFRPPAVEVKEAAAENRRTEIDAMGTVVPARTLVVQPEVGGKVLEVHPSLVRGGRLSEGEVLLRLDAREYELAVSQQRSLVEQSEAELKLEQGRRAVARQEWQLFEGELVETELGRELALREPQIRKAEATLQSARDALERALLNVERTVITAPFNALVLEEGVEAGQIVGTQSRLATIVGTDEFHLQVSLPAERLDLLSFADDGGPGSRARVIAGGGKEGAAGRVLRLLGELDPAGRMARVVIAVRDPLSLTDRGRAPLLLGSYVRAVIEGESLEHVFEIPRSALRPNDTVWVLGPGSRLEVRRAVVAWQMKDSLLLRGGLEGGDLVITSSLSNPVPGMELRLRDSLPGGEPAEGEPGGDEGAR